MGYTTEFEGSFDLDKPLKPAHAEYLRTFSETRRMQRNPVVAAKMPDPIREAVSLPIGEDGGFFVGGKGHMGQNDDSSIINYNHVPAGQPGLWCKWAPNEDGTAIVWNGAEKFYNYIEWIVYLIEKFLQPWGYCVDGTVRWQGEEPDDLGCIEVKANVVTVKGAFWSSKMGKYVFVEEKHRVLE